MADELLISCCIVSLIFSVLYFCKNKINVWNFNSSCILLKEKNYNYVEWNFLLLLSVFIGLNMTVFVVTYNIYIVVLIYLVILIIGVFLVDNNDANFTIIPAWCLTPIQISRYWHQKCIKFKQKYLYINYILKVIKFQHFKILVPILPITKFSVAFVL